MITENNQIKPVSFKVGNILNVISLVSSIPILMYIYSRYTSVLHSHMSFGMKLYILETAYPLTTFCMIAMSIWLLLKNAKGLYLLYAITAYQYFKIPLMFGFKYSIYNEQLNLAIATIILTTLLSVYYYQRREYLKKSKINILVSVLAVLLVAGATVKDKYADKYFSNKINYVNTVIEWETQKYADLGITLNFPMKVSRVSTRIPDNMPFTLINLYGGDYRRNLIVQIAGFKAKNNVKLKIADFVNMVIRGKSSVAQNNTFNPEVSEVILAGQKMTLVKGVVLVYNTEYNVSSYLFINGDLVGNIDIMVIKNGEIATLCAEKMIKSIVID